ncbi:unnamed protein product [Calypogeia fissa]
MLSLVGAIFNIISWCAAPSLLVLSLWKRSSTSFNSFATNYFHLTVSGASGTPVIREERASEKNKKSS